MYAFVYRFVHSEDEDTINSLNPILGGAGWRNRLGPSLDRGHAVETLFRETLKASGDFEFVVSTKIDKATTERPHFFIAYGTKSLEGLKAFRQVEYKSLRMQEKNRANAKERLREERTNMSDLFAGHQSTVKEATIDEIVEEQMTLASTALMETLSTTRTLPFSSVLVALLEPYMLRVTNVKDICVDLANAGKIEITWGSGSQKPRDDSIIKLMAPVDNTISK